MKKLNNILESIAKPLMPITPWLLRLGLGTSFILHGIGKFPLPPEKMVTWFESMGYMYPEIVTSMVAVGEVAANAVATLRTLPIFPTCSAVYSRQFLTADVVYRRRLMWLSR